MLKKILIASISASILIARVATACYPACGWSSWGDRQNVCASSEPVAAAELACACSGPCATDCASWCAGYDACASSGVATCLPGTASSACNSCIYIGCAAEVAACSADVTGCTSSCASWLLGGDAICDVVTQEEVDISDCACNGACKNKCPEACYVVGGKGYLDNFGVFTQQCTACLAAKHGCATEHAACATL